MPPSQREIAQAVVKIRIPPVCWIMAGGAIYPVLTAMFVILAMTGIAISWRTDVRIVLMAGLTSRISVFSFQFEGRKIVIELRRAPPVHGMTGGAIPAKAALMGLVAAVT